MASKLTISLLSESQKGTIGNDWKYSLEAKVFSGGLQGKGTISVPKHTLDSGKTQAPPGPPEAMEIAAGEPGTEVSLDLRLAVAEVDLLQNDTAEKSYSFKLMCPAAGSTPLVEERELTIGVSEEPSGIGNSVFKLALRLTLASD